MCWLHQSLISTWTYLLFGMTFLRCIIYRVQMSGVRVAQNCLIPSLSSSRFFGLYTFRKYCLSELHIFSMGLRSGDSGGVAHQFTPCSLKKSSIWPLECFGSLSCCSWWPSGKHSLRNGSKPASYTVAKRSAFIIPVKITALVAPSLICHPRCALLPDVWLAV